MEIAGVITEYNPFHNGHLYHLQQTKKLTEAEALICIMNGNFVQRGYPAIIDKWSRTKMALDNGVDLVIELPVVYGIRSAEYFADGAVSLLAATGIVNHLVFGSEQGQLKPLQQLARILSREPGYFRKRLKYYLGQGLSFPGARERALIDYLELESDDRGLLPQLENIISQPNNILGLEYLKSLIQLDMPLQPHTINRISQAYHVEELDSEKQINSATAIRKSLRKRGVDSLRKVMPESCLDILHKAFQQQATPPVIEHLSMMVLGKLRQMSLKEIESFAETGNGLARRIYRASSNSGDLQQLINNIKTRAFTETRIRRVILQILLGLRERDFREVDEEGPAYLRILGFNKQGENILSRLADNSQLPLVTRPVQYLTQPKINSSDPLEKQLSFDLLASDLYALLSPGIDQRQGRQDFYTPLVKV